MHVMQDLRTYFLHRVSYLYVSHTAYTWFHYIHSYNHMVLQTQTVETVSYGGYLLICGLHLLLLAIRRAQLMSSYSRGSQSFISEQTPHASHACNYTNSTGEARKNIP